MGSNTNNLDRESLLLLYAADELPLVDRQRVEGMLAKDPALHAQLDELTATQEQVAGMFAEADASRPLPAPVLSSARGVSAAIAQWQVDRMTRPTPMRLHHVKKHGWLYASGAIAAGIIVTVFVLWSRVDDGKSQLAKMPWDPDQSSDVKPDQNTPDQNTVGTPADAPDAHEELAQIDQNEPLRMIDPDDYTPGGAAMRIDSSPGPRASLTHSAHSRLRFVRLRTR